MFTGIIEELGTVLSVQFHERDSFLEIKAPRIFPGLEMGDSIAVNGVCLTASGLAKDSFRADVMPETMRQTNLHMLTPGERVNLERALTPSSRIGGHFVSGHVDGVGKITRKKLEGNAIVFTVKAPQSVLRYTVERGSIAVDGISLTVIEIEKVKQEFSVSIIPHTASLTTLGFKRVGDIVNLESDMLAKYVANFLAERDKGPGSNITEEYLKEKGFF
ncbi:MAG: riboflavin synthase [Firmicutes bacterium]|nr:riboflavin synthase [Bacillota bacterium]